MVTGNADREGVESRKDRFGHGRWFLVASRQQYRSRKNRRVNETGPGIPGRVEPYIENVW